MSLRRIVRFIIGVLVAGLLLGILLPFFGIPSSHYLPPSKVYATADGATKGAVVSKYYDETGNPFTVGAQLYFLNYQFKAHAPAPRGVTTPGPVQVYTGTIRVDQPTYDQCKLPTSEANNTYKAKEVIQLAPFPVHIKYEKTYPEINGISDGWANGARNIGAGSALLSGWIIWLLVILFVGYLFMMIFERFGKQEDL